MVDGLTLTGGCPTTGLKEKRDVFRVVYAFLTHANFVLGMAVGRSATAKRRLIIWPLSVLIESDDMSSPTNKEILCVLVDMMINVRRFFDHDDDDEKTIRSVRMKILTFMMLRRPSVHIHLDVFIVDFQYIS